MMETLSGFLVIAGYGAIGYLLGYNVAKAKYIRRKWDDDRKDGD